jgi:RNA polymerase sigma-70 factor (ECF subfamily)
MRKAADDDIEAFKRFHKRYAQRLKQFFLKRGANRDLADDLVQKIFASLWQQRQNYPLDSSFEAYLYSIARNTLYSEIRRSRRMAGINSIKHHEFRADTHKMLSQPEAELYFQELTEALEAAKAELTDEQRQALEAFQCRDIALDKTSEQLGCSKEAYKKRLKRARKQIMKLLAQYFTDKKG